MEWNILTRKKGLPFKAEDTSKRGDRLAAPPLWIGTYFTTRYRPAKWNSQRQYIHAPLDWNIFYNSLPPSQVELPAVIYTPDKPSILDLVKI